MRYVVISGQEDFLWLKFERLDELRSYAYGAQIVHEAVYGRKPEVLYMSRQEFAVWRQSHPREHLGPNTSLYAYTPPRVREYLDRVRDGTW